MFFTVVNLWFSLHTGDISQDIVSWLTDSIDDCRFSIAEPDLTSLRITVQISNGPLLLLLLLLLSSVKHIFQQARYRFKFNTEAEIQ